MSSATFLCNQHVLCGVQYRRGFYFALNRQPLIEKRKLLGADARFHRSRYVVCSITLLLELQSDSGDIRPTFVDEESSKPSENIEFQQTDGDELLAAQIALADARAREQAFEKERGILLEKLGQAEAKQHEYATAIMHEKEMVVAELEAAKDLFHKKLQESVDEKFDLKSKLILAKQDAVELAVQVEKLAEIAFQQAMSHILEDTQLRVSAAETSAADATYQIEEQIRSATEGTLLSIVDQGKSAIAKALAVAKVADDRAKRYVAAPMDDSKLIDEIASIKFQNVKLQQEMYDLQSQLLVYENDFNKESNRKSALKQQGELKLLFNKIKEDAVERGNATSNAFKAELETLKSAVQAAKETARSKDEASLRRSEALQRSLRASEAASIMWRRRAELAETLLLKQVPLGERNEDSTYVVNGGRVDLLMDDNSRKLKLLTDGPRREIPEWMLRRIQSICPRFPPRKTSLSEAKISNFKTLELPKPDEVWSIALEKPKEGDTLVEHVMEKEVIEKKRKALERALQRKTIQWQRTAEETKLEPGTGTGREIVFQGFNWESWRRQWYLDLAPKAADLSRSGITAVWFPPPTESVAPQGYMPSDLYNLNSAYGSEEELKHCIEEMRNHDLLTLGDVVLNHRCAQKQSPNGVWNIFGGKLSWGPEAIVCDDPNFQGRGNPSSGDIFHAAPNVDHSQDFVRRDIKEWLNWLRNDIGFDGWRLDFARGFSGAYVKEYIEASNPAFAIGEYWDSLAYEGGNLCYNQDAHRQRIVNWINATGGTSSAFDVTTKGILHSALHNQYWRLIDPQGKPTGVMGWWPSRAVTFLENHDTGSTQGHWPFPRDKLMQGYAYILTHPGTPVIFYDHFYDFGIRDVITELIEARRRGGIHCRSPLKILHANDDGYVAKVGETLVMKLGHFDWNPSKEVHLDGSWQKFVDKGSDYQLWLRQ
ncbi:alpha-amylase 3, chloroplastic-like isoform X3 [Salvia splendens]|uniref:alpha-amylase 3, chloroplastic-like isoform X3 n=1 Tax=Salvia splendens TaxID=180675 RepID=UPI001C274E69|nr:alpha-amylase 3, chloroplastic-like isoform X3 [Salvia splendens]